MAKRHRRRRRRSSKLVLWAALVLLIVGFLAKRAGVLNYLIHRPAPTANRPAINLNEPVEQPASQNAEGGEASSAPQPSPENVSDARSSPPPAAQPAGVRENLSESDRRGLDEVLRRKLKQK